MRRRAAAHGFQPAMAVRSIVRTWDGGAVCRERGRGPCRWRRRGARTRGPAPRGGRAGSASSRALSRSTVRRVRLRSPRSTPPTKVRWTARASARASCDSPRCSRRRRRLRPNCRCRSPSTGETVAACYSKVYRPISSAGSAQLSSAGPGTPRARGGGLGRRPLRRERVDRGDDGGRVVRVDRLEDLGERVDVVDLVVEVVAHLGGRGVAQLVEVDLRDAQLRERPLGVGGVEPLVEQRA